jgi:hypothetical protein
MRATANALRNRRKLVEEFEPKARALAFIELERYAPDPGQQPGVPDTLSELLPQGPNNRSSVFCA